MRGLAVVLILMIAMFSASQSEDRWPRFAIEDVIWPDSDQEGRFGESVATDGERILIGAPDGGSAVLSGTATIYQRQGPNWVVEANLQPHEATAGMRFGQEVAILGTLAAVGAPAHNGGPLSPAEGLVEIFEYKNGWKHRVTLSSPDPVAGGNFGAALLLQDGFLFVGEPGPDASLGAGHVYRYHTSDWKLAQTFTDDSVSHRYGAAIDADRNMLVIGAPAKTGVDTVQDGRAFFFERQGDAWFGRGSVSGEVDGEAVDSFGHNVAVSGNDAVVTTQATFDGQTATVGGGDAYFFEYDGSSWQLLQIERSEMESVDMTDGIALIGAYYWENLAVMKKIDGHWWIIGWLGDFSFFGNNEAEEFGFDLAFHGRVAVAGAPQAGQGQSTTGAAHAFYDNWPPWAYAGSDETLDDFDGDGRETFTLDGSHSDDWDGEIVSYEWFEDGERISKEPIVELTRPLGTHTFTLLVEDDLGAQDADAVTIKVRTPTTQASFEFYPSNPYPWQTVSFYDRSSDLRAPIHTWEWDFNGDGSIDSTARNPRYEYDARGTETVTLTTTNTEGGTLQSTRDIEFRPRWPEANAGGDRVVIDENNDGIHTIHLDGRASTDDGTIEQYSWYIGSNSYNTAEADHTALQGVHDAFLTVRDNDGLGGSDWATILLLPPGYNSTIEDRPDAKFEVEHWGGGYVFVTDTSTTDGPRIVIHRWDFNQDGVTDARWDQAYHRYEEPGTYEIRMTVIAEDGGESLARQHVTIDDQPPEAWFWPDYAVVPVGAYLIFQDYSWDDWGIKSREWSFSDGMRSSHQDLGREFHREGVVSVTLTVSDGATTDVREGTIEVISEDAYEERFGEAFDELAALNETTAQEVGGLQQATPPPSDDPVEEVVEEITPIPEEKTETNSGPETAKWMGIPLWIPAILFLLVLAAILVILPMRKQ